VGVAVVGIVVGAEDNLVVMDIVEGEELVAAELSAEGTVQEVDAACDDTDYSDLVGGKVGEYYFAAALFYIFFRGSDEKKVTWI
jgi:hypothetical protein